MNINQLVSRTVMVGLLAAVAGCASYPTGVIGQPAPNSKFSKIRIGMSQAQVIELIGDSKDCQDTTDLLSAVNPLNFRAMANGTLKVISCPYKGEGILTYDIYLKVYGITVDKTEDGFINATSQAALSSSGSGTTCTAKLKAAGKCK